MKCAGKYNLKGIILSNSEYGSGISRLEGAVNSARLLQKELGDGVELWINEDSAAAKEKIRKYLSYEVFSERDVFLFYFCSHGDVAGKGYDELILECKDTTSDNYADGTGIEYEWLIKIIKQKVATRYVIILDCCKSGLVSAMGAKEISLDVHSLETGSHAAIITSTSTVDASIEMSIRGKLYAAFTYFMAQSLKEGIAGKGEYLQLNDLFLEVKRRVIEHNSRESIPYLPAPQIKNVGLINQVDLFRNRVNEQGEGGTREEKKTKNVIREGPSEYKYSLRGGFSDLYDHSGDDSKNGHLIKGGFNDIL